MAKRARHQRLKTPPVEMQILGRVNPGLLRFAQGLGARRAQGDDENFRPFLLNLVKRLPRVLGP